MSTQTVYRLVSPGSFEGLQPTQEAISHAGKYEILVRVRSVALNFRDIAIARDIFPLPVKENLVPCSDMAGEVLQVGEGVGGFAIGDHVIAPVSLIVLYGPVKDEDNSLGGSVDGVLRQYLVLPAHSTVKLPRSSHTFSDWAATVTTAYTVWNAFYGCSPLRPGQTVLLLGSDHSNS
jgi:NADPH:quinone reductase-like Zn-dependent oxidoreductase